jgi:hypothetical protein
MPRMYRLSDEVGLAQLTVDERQALGALLHLAVRLDGGSAGADHAVLASMAAELGHDVWEILEATADVEARQARRLAESVTRRPARELVFALVAEVVYAGAFSNDGAALIDWLRERWQIQEETVGPQPDGD